MTRVALDRLQQKIEACEICVDRFAQTKTAHSPRPVIWLSSKAKILIAGQAPGARVHKTGRPFTDRSGDRLREWMAVDETVFYDRNKVAILPMAFCFPGYDAKGSDLPPPKICASKWNKLVLSLMPQIEVTLLVGKYAQSWHLPDTKKSSMTKRVMDWQEYAPSIFTLPHPSWRNTGWIGKNPWFESELLPMLRHHIAHLLKEI